MARGRKPRQQQNNGANEAVVEQWNMSNRAVVIRSAVAWVSEKMAEVAAINAEIREYKTKHIKGDLGWKIADFNAVLRVAMLEDDRRDSFLDTLREGFAALGVGESVDWVKAAETRPKPTYVPAPEPGSLNA